jgi:hypothetical protein
MAVRKQPEDLLLAVAQTLRAHGRPRKNPGMPRPYAVLFDRTVRKTITRRYMPDIWLLSLPAAFRYVQLHGRYSPSTAEKAKAAFYEAHTGLNGGFSTAYVDQEITRIDQDTCDTRKILRNLKAAVKNLRKGE